ncbi:uncharacterized protein LOC134196786 [Corticium candelabrum]|uniref:uncharacterized protein LOC134196786 n=1 Tax=Corticium candelabrum TaxID=121492 RepID=UPI002E2550C9|nr:uncharacterized protein LOC134196786 [Corticium candelabrum]
MGRKNGNNLDLKRPSLRHDIRPRSKGVSISTPRIFILWNPYIEKARRLELLSPRGFLIHFNSQLKGGRVFLSYQGGVSACTGLQENETLSRPSVDKFECYDNGDNWSIVISVIFEDDATDGFLVAISATGVGEPLNYCRLFDRQQITRTLEVSSLSEKEIYFIHVYGTSGNRSKSYNVFEKVINFSDCSPPCSVNDPLLSGDIAVGKPNLYRSNDTVHARFCIHTSILININEALTISHVILSVRQCCRRHHCYWNSPSNESPSYPPGIHLIDWPVPDCPVHSCDCELREGSIIEFDVCRSPHENTCRQTNLTIPVTSNPSTRMSSWKIAVLVTTLLFIIPIIVIVTVMRSRRSRQVHRGRGHVPRRESKDLPNGPTCDCEWFTSQSPRVLFVHSTADENHWEKCRKMVDTVSSFGINVTSHRLEERAVAGNISTWVTSHIDCADYIVYICSKELNDDYNNRGGNVEGDSQELRALCYHIGGLPTHNPTEFGRKCVPVVFRIEDRDNYLPTIMRDLKYYQWPLEKNDIVNRLKGN